jgi:hypothetical protein
MIYTLLMAVTKLSVALVAVLVLVGVRHLVVVRRVRRHVQVVAFVLVLKAGSFLYKCVYLSSASVRA